MSDLAELKKRVKEATGPDRKLDAEIDAALFGGKPSHLCEQRARRSYGPGTVFDLHGQGEDYNGSFILSADVRHAGEYTHSIDAAFGLVEKMLPGWFVLFNTGSVAPGKWSKVDTRPRAELAEPIETKFGSGVGIRAQLHGATPPLAILSALLAALKSRETK